MKPYDVVVVGAGMGGLSAAALLAKAGRNVLVLEANYLPGGCCSSYWRKGYVFESGATTLMGLDAGQPLALLQQQLGLELPLQHLSPAMTVWLDGQQITRYQGRETWMEEAIPVFGQAAAQRKFWATALQLSDFVWQASGRNLGFPPSSIGDVVQLIRHNSPRHYPLLRYAFTSTQQVLKQYGLHTNQPFCRFVDEQLLITAQAGATAVPFLLGATCLCYTNYSNYNLLGGMIQLPLELIRKLGTLGGELQLRQPVTRITQQGTHFTLQTRSGDAFTTRQVLSNLPLWNLPALTTGKLQAHFNRQAARITSYWGAFTMSLAVQDTFAGNTTLHHQVILPQGQQIPHCGSHSIFISLSAKGDVSRAPLGTRVLAISTHAAQPGNWFAAGAEYEVRKTAVVSAILEALEKHWPLFNRQEVLYETESTPVSWQKWTQRHEGTVGGVPQGARPLLAWPGAQTIDPNFFLCGDTVYPGQGVPGVVLSGIIAARRMLAS